MHLFRYKDNKFKISAPALWNDKFELPDRS